MSAFPNSNLYVPASIQEPFRSCLDTAAGAWMAALQERLISIVLFGSVARGTARPDSDLDVLVVAEGFPRTLAERRGILLQGWEGVRSATGLPPIVWSLVTKTPGEAATRSPLYLDMVDEGILVLDRGGFFRSVLDGLARRMRELGTRRVMLDDGSWYWDLKPDFRWGEVVEL